MFPLIRRLQEKPESYRKRFSLIVSFSITLLIIGVWISSASVRFSDTKVAVDDVEKVQTASPMSTFNDDFISLKDKVFGTVSNVIGSLGSVKYSAENVSK